MVHSAYVTTEEIIDFYKKMKDMSFSEIMEIGRKKKNNKFWITIISVCDISTQEIMNIVNEANEWPVALMALKTKKLSQSQILKILEIYGDSIYIFIEAMDCLK